MKAVQYAPLVENGCSRGVQVLGHRIVQGPGPEPRHAPSRVVYREHQASLEEVPGAAILLLKQAGLHHDVLGKPQPRQMGLQPVPSVGAQAQLKPVDGLLIDVSLPEISGPFHALGGPQEITIELGGVLVNAVQPLGAVVFARGSEGDAGLLGQQPDRTGEIQALPPHDESEQVPPGGARAKAPPTLSLWVDYERGGLLRVERTGCLEVPARLLEADVARHDLDDVQPRLYVIDDAHARLSGPCAFR